MTIQEAMQAKAEVEPTRQERNARFAEICWEAISAAQQCKLASDRPEVFAHVKTLLYAALNAADLI